MNWQLFFRTLLALLAVASFVGFGFMFVLGIMKKQLVNFLVAIAMFALSCFFGFASWRLDKAIFWSCRDEHPSTYVSF